MNAVVKPLSIGVAIRQAWAGFKDNLLFYLVSVFVGLLVYFGYSYYMGDLAPTEVLNNPNGTTEVELSSSSIFAHIVAFIAYIIFLLGYLLGMFRASIKVIRGGVASFADYFKSPGDLWRFFLGYILYFLIVFAGLILLVFPAIIWGIRYAFFPYLIADKHVGAIDSLKLSSQATFGAKWDLFGFFLVIQALWFASLLTLGLGLFIVTPLWALTKAAFYVTLTKDEA